MSDQLRLDVEVKNPIKPALANQLRDWKCLYPFFEGPEWVALKNAIKPDMEKVVPIPDKWFRAFTACEYKDLKVVFIGLCPYHTLDGYTKQIVADGLAFSTAQKHNTPPSLFKVYKGIEADLWQGMNLDMMRYLELDFLAHQGILLANIALTTILGTAAYHTKVWEPFTKFLIDTLNKEKEGLIFVGFGVPACKALQQVDQTKHTLIELEHPAASAYESRDWRHENVFSRINDILRHQNQTEILWDKYLVDIKVPF
jgi:uracil-DNA glycosylase